MAANYNRTAWFYDRLSYLVFGQAQVKAQNHFLHFIKPGNRILIAGGGTGRILEAITQLYPQGLHITYVEVSASMVELSRKRNVGGNIVNFVTADICHYQSTLPFDVIITAFLFDNFTEPSLQKAFERLQVQLKAGGLWLDTDFQLTGPFWQKLMLKAMYTFFKLFGAVQVSRLPDVKMLFKQQHYAQAGSKTFYRRFIHAGAYYKPD